MLKLLCLVLFSAVMAERSNINGLLDRFIKEMNERQRKTGATAAPLPEISFSQKVKYSSAVFLGIDSLQRTNDCWQEEKGSDVSYDIHYGFRLMAIILPHLEIQGKNMSGYASVGDNSVHLAFTMHLAQEKCNVTLERLLVERMKMVDLRASRLEYDGLHLDSYFQTVIVPALNSIVIKYFDKIEASLQTLCKLKDFKEGAELQDVMSSLHD